MCLCFSIRSLYVLYCIFMYSSLLALFIIIIVIWAGHVSDRKWIFPTLPTVRQPVAWGNKSLRFLKMLIVLMIMLMMAKIIVWVCSSLWCCHIEDDDDDDVSHGQACPVLCSTDRADDDNEDYKQSILMMLKGNLYLYSLWCFKHSDPNLAKSFQISLLSDLKFYFVHLSLL